MVSTRTVPSRRLAAATVKMSPLPSMLLGFVQLTAKKCKASSGEPAAAIADTEPFSSTFVACASQTPAAQRDLSQVVAADDQVVTGHSGVDWPGAGRQS